MILYCTNCGNGRPEVCADCMRRLSEQEQAIFADHNAAMTEAADVRAAAERILGGCVPPTLDFGDFDPDDIETVARAALAASEREQRLREAILHAIDWTRLPIHEYMRKYSHPPGKRGPNLIALLEAALSETGPAGAGRGAEDKR